MQNLYKALLYSISGIKLAWLEERAFRLEIIIASIAIPLAFVLAPDKTSLLLMIGSVLLVIALELINTAIEATVNLVGTGIRPMAKKAKDTASAAILIAAINAAIIWFVSLFT